VNGTPIADHLLRFEHLQSDYAKLHETLLLGTDGKIERHMKGSFRPEGFKGAEGIARLFTPALIDHVRAQYPFYFERFGCDGPGSDCPKFVPEPRRMHIRRRLEGQAIVAPSLA